jgi:uncharacterized protein (TIGR04562 family)
VNFDPLYFQNMVGGLNTLDVPHLSVQTAEQARDFASAYGFNLDSPKDMQRLWNYFHRAVTYIQSELLYQDESLPDLFSSQEKLSDLTELLIMASKKDHPHQIWACGILKVMHALCHLDNDLFTSYSAQIQDQILKPLQEHVKEGPGGVPLLVGQGQIKELRLEKFESKTFKTTTSSITKLLAKPELVAFSLMDKIGVRFVTEHLVDVFWVLRYLIENNIVCFAHNIPDQANNTLYPLNLYLEVFSKISEADGARLSPQQWDELLEKKRIEAGDRAEYREKFNSFTSQDYRFLKFISRRLIHIKEPDISFFYPFEVQIVDHKTYESNRLGSASHDQYKERQIRRARARIFGFKVPGAE